MGDSDDSTIFLTNIKETLQATDKEAQNLPACLIIQGGELNGTIYDLKPLGINEVRSITIGRNPENEISLDFQGVSRKHLQIDIKGLNEALTDISVTLVDLGSKNGTYLNEQKLEGSKLLQKGDIIKVGPFALKYIPHGDSERLTYDKLNQDAVTDGLTRCYNKAYFNQHCEMEVKKSKALGTPLSLILFDLDHFKKLNDTYGHDAGDYTLKELSQLIRNGGVREGDIFARYGGEEFVVLLPHTNLKQAFEIAERLRLLVAEHDFLYDGKKLPVTSSVGVADFRQGVETGTDLFKRVDAALYKSKEGGRNQVNFYKAAA
jgi:two-component system cell cycle response regulator